jgi:hypothetical protein
MRHDPALFAMELPLLFAVTAFATVILAIGIRLLFRRGKSITDL